VKLNFSSLSNSAKESVRNLNLERDLRISENVVANDSALLEPAGIELDLSEIDLSDDRCFCSQCRNFRDPRCLAAARGEIAARKGYEPCQDFPRRCEAFAPLSGDPDQRPGAQRWPSLAGERWTHSETNLVAESLRDL
jgi:hypothetical protein